MKTAAAALASICLFASAARADDEVLTPVPERKAALQPTAPPTQPAAQPEHHSRVPEIIATIATGALVIGIVGAHAKWDAAQDLARSDKDVLSFGDGMFHYRHIQDVDRWRKVTWGLVGATFVSSMVTAFLWTRHQTSASITVDPDDGGASAAITGNF